MTGTPIALEQSAFLLFGLYPERRRDKKSLFADETVFNGIRFT
jgi:hypothetical protein